MVLFLRFNLAETTSAWPLQSGGQAQQKPDSVKLPWQKLNAKKSQHSGRDQKPSMLETRTAKTNSAESSCGSVSDCRRPPVQVGIPHSYGWKDIMANKILNPLQSLISCFLEPPANRPMAVGAIEGLWRGYSPVYPEGSIILCALVAVVQAGGGSSVLNLLCAEDQANENCEHRSGIFSRFSSRLWRGFLSTFFPLLFPPFLQFLSASVPLLTNYWAGHHLFISESCACNCFPKIGTQTHVAGTLCHI